MRKRTGSNLKAYLVKSGLKMYEIAERAKIHPNTLSAACTGRIVLSDADYARVKAVVDEAINGRCGDTAAAATVRRSKGSSS